MIKDMIRLSIFLAVACAIAAASLSIAYVATADRIEAQKKAEIDAALASVGDYTFRVAPKGYGGAIDMIVGIDKNGKVTGIKILSMKETPGLGTKAAGPEFLSQFLGKTSKSPLKARKDIDAITGATITSQAVCEGVREALNKFHRGGF